ncbi:MAG: peptidylprolyl isomerase [Eubacteriales bacterium]
MSGIKRMALLFLTLVLLMGVFAGCSSYRKGDETLIMTVGGYEVTGEFYRYVCMKNCVQLYGAEALERPLTEREEQELQSAVETELQRYFAIEKMAEEQKVALSKEDTQLIKDQLEEARESYEQEEEYYASLESAYMSENVYYEQAKNYYLNRNLFYSFKSSYTLPEEQLRQDIQEYFYAAVQILLNNRGQYASTLERMQELRKTIQTEEDFYEAAKLHSADTNRGVRYCCVGEMQPYFEKAALSLKPGEISEIIESDLGVHLIMRVQITEEAVNDQLEQFRDEDLVRIFNGQLSEIAGNLEVVYQKDHQGLILS